MTAGVPVTPGGGGGGGASTPAGLRAAELQARTFLVEPSGLTDSLTLRKGGLRIFGSDPAYSTDYSWHTFTDPADRRGARFARPHTVDDNDSLLTGPVFDIATAGGIDITTAITRSHAPCITVSTQWYLAQQSVDGSPPLRDYAVVYKSDGCLYFEWNDSDDDFNFVRFMLPFPLFPEHNGFQARAAIRYNGGTITALMFVKGHDLAGAWCTCEPAVTGKVGGAEVSGTITGEHTPRTRAWTYAGDPKFETRAGGIAFGYGRGDYSGALVVRAPSASPYASPGAVDAQCTLADGVDKIPGESFTSNSDTWELGPTTRGLIMNPTEAGWLMDDYSSQTVTHSAALDFDGNWTAVVRFTPRDQQAAGSAPYVAKAATPGATVGFLVSDLRVASLGHVVGIHDGDTLYADTGITVTDDAPMDLVVVCDRAADTLTVYKNGVARTPIDISACGDITNTENLVFSGGTVTPTMVHLGTGFDFARAWSAAEVSAHRAAWGWT